jgi:hypothetical protein
MLKVPFAESVYIIIVTKLESEKCIEIEVLSAHI